MTKRIITARVDAEVEMEIEFLKRHFIEKNTTTILIKAIHNLFNEIRQQKTKLSPFEILEELNLIGCFEGEKLLSQNYKDKFSRSLNKKINKKR